MKQYPQRISGQRQRGVSLLEVLIAVLILSFGLLGVAALQVRSLQGTQSSNFRSNAALLTHEIVDAIRANRSRAVDYRIALGSGEPSTEGIAGTDLSNWRRRIAQQLPQAQSAIAVVSTATPVPPSASGAPQPASLAVRVIVTIQWQDARWLGTDALGQTTVITTTEI
ncbi:MAG: type IV pilus modification protein PilV [Xanthomonadales bacterium]|nr:type IV pilus modification protein PilV [Xanthomonadales bacterium]